MRALAGYGGRVCDNESFGFRLQEGRRSSTAVKEREYVERLLRDRELDRAQIVRVAAQAEQAERNLSFLQAEHDRVGIESISCSRRRKAIGDRVTVLSRLSRIPSPVCLVYRFHLLPFFADALAARNRYR